MAITRWIHSIIIVPFGIGRLCLCCTVLDCKPGDVDDDSNSNNLQRIEALGVDLQQGDIVNSEKPDLYEIGGQVGPKVYASWAVKKGNKAMLDALNDGLAKVKASGEMNALQEKWLKVTFDLPDTPVFHLLKVVDSIAWRLIHVGLEA